MGEDANVVEQTLINASFYVVTDINAYKQQVVLFCTFPLLNDLHFKC